MAQTRITKQFVDACMPAPKDQFAWDTTVKGFGLKITPRGSKIYIVQSRLTGSRGGRPVRVTIGKHGSPWTAENARVEAKRLLGVMSTGANPNEIGRHDNSPLLVSELCDIYLEQGVGTKKESTLSTDRGRIKRHIKPLLGKLKVIDVSKVEVRKFLNDVANGKTATDIKTGVRGRAIVRGGKGTATRTAGLLSGIFSFAVESGYLESNPVHGVPRFADKKNERFLSASEIADIGTVLTEMEREAVNPKAINIIRLLLLTGARRGEIEKLKWSEVDLANRILNLEDSKTGQKRIPLNRPAYEILNTLSASKGSVARKYVFQAESSEVPYSGTPRIWRSLRERIGASELRIHDLRHSFASLAVSQGASLPMIGALLGHADTTTTQRYAHLSDDPLRHATELVGKAISEVWKK